MTEAHQPELIESRKSGLQWPVIIAEALSIVAAVLIALAVDEWWEDRENRELADTALVAVMAELRNNRQRLQRGDEGIAAQLEELSDITAILERDEKPESLQIDYPVALLSSAAWQSAQITRAVHYLPWETVTSVATVYDVQAFFLRNQDQLTDLIAEMSAMDEDTALQMIRRIDTRLRMVVGFRQALATAYACLAVELGQANPEEKAACPSTG